ncbi:hypothetical protein H1C71_036229, partial [Ictidomys tridecemlineatus]
AALLAGFVTLTGDGFTSAQQSGGPAQVSGNSSTCGRNRPESSSQGWAALLSVSSEQRWKSPAPASFASHPTSQPAQGCWGRQVLGAARWHRRGACAQWRPSPYISPDSRCSTGPVFWLSPSPVGLP